MMNNTRILRQPFAAILTLLLGILCVTSANGAEFSFDLKRQGRISAAIYERGTGRMIRELLRGEQRATGRHTLAWDGLDRDGNAQPDGTYDWKILSSQGFTATHALTLGINPPDATHAYWLGNHTGGPNTAVEDETGLYLGAWMAEGPLILLKLSPDHKTRLWQRQQNYDGEDPFALALAGGHLFALNRSGNLQRLHRETGEVEHTFPLVWDGVKASDLAAQGTALALSYRGKSAVRLLDLNGQVTATIDVPTPDRLAFSPTGELLVTSGDKVLSIALDTKQVVERLTGLASPRALAVNPATGALFVAETSIGIDNELGAVREPEGKKNDQIKHFDQNFQLIAELGAKGGRQTGFYNRRNFLGVTDLLVLKDGRLLVTEIAMPRRTCIIAPDTGEVEAEWFGGQEFYTYAVMDPEHPDEVWFSPHANAIVQTTVDWAHKTWTVKSCNYLPEGFGAVTKVYQSHGIRYLVGSQPQVLRQDATTGVLTPIFTTKQDEQGNPYTWADANEDGVEQADEKTPMPREAVRGLQQGSIVNDEFDFVAGCDGKTAYWMLKRTGWTGKHNSVPVWDWRELIEGPELPQRLLPETGNSTRQGVQDAQGNLYQVYFAHLYPGLERHGDAWPANEVGFCRLLKWSPAGELLWDASRHGVQPGERGELFRPAKMMAVAHGCVIALDRGNQNPEIVWDQDGLYAGTLHDHRAADGLPDYVYDWKKTLDDHEVGTVYELPNGEVLSFRDADGWTYAFRIHGWDQLKRQQGTVQLSGATAAQRQGTGLSGTYYKDANFGEVAFTRIDPKLRFGARNDFDGGELFPKWWLKDGQDSGVNPTAISVTWEGSLEPTLTADHQFSIYLTGQAKLWLDDQLILDTASQTPTVGEGPQKTRVSEPISLVAGRKVAVRVEYQSSENIKTQFSGYNGPVFHLHWEGLNLDRWSLPSSALYPK